MWYHTDNQTRRHDTGSQTERGEPPKEGTHQRKKFFLTNVSLCDTITVQSDKGKRKTFRLWAVASFWMTDSRVVMCDTSEHIHQTEQSPLYRGNHCTLKTTQCASVPPIATEHSASVFSAYRYGKQGTQVLVLCSRLQAFKIGRCFHREKCAYCRTVRGSASVPTVESRQGEILQWLSLQVTTIL